MNESKIKSGWTSNIYTSIVQHYIKEGNEYTACNRYSIYENEKAELLPIPIKKRGICKTCLKSYQREKKLKENKK